MRLGKTFAFCTYGWFGTCAIHSQVRPRPSVNAAWCPEKHHSASWRLFNYGVTNCWADVVITSDGEVLVSHEPYMSQWSVPRPNGEPVTKDEERKYNIYKMSYAETKVWLWTKVSSALSEQKNSRSPSPCCETWSRQSRIISKLYGLYEVDYNIEIKSVQGEKGKFQPSVEEFRGRCSKWSTKSSVGAWWSSRLISGCCNTGIKNTKVRLAALEKQKSVDMNPVPRTRIQSIDLQSWIHTDKIDQAGSKSEEEENVPRYPLDGQRSRNKWNGCEPGVLDGTHGLSWSCCRLGHGHKRTTPLRCPPKSIEVQLGRTSCWSVSAVRLSFRFVRRNWIFQCTSGCLNHPLWTIFRLCMDDTFRIVFRAAF